MIIKESGLKYAKLIHVSVDNGSTAQSNKVYIMEELSDGRVKCEYGRVGKVLVTVYKQSSEWTKVYKNKLSKTKGYTDVTDMVTETHDDNSVDIATTKSGTLKEINCKKTNSLFHDLMAFANKSIQKNYKVTQESVTEAQVDSAQDIITEAVKTLKKGSDVKSVNDLLIKLYTVIPRKMDDVRDHIINSTDNKSDLDLAKELLTNEQDTLDTMSGQVQLLKQQREANAKVDKDTKDGIIAADLTILDQMGLTAEEETDKEGISLVNKLMGKNSNQIKKIIRVTNNKTQVNFDTNLKKAKNKKRRLYWHGSRNENWFNIIQTGLMIRPSGAIHTGSMFGDGIYFADKAQKSIGYSSFNGYWTGGRADKGYLALFDVHLGNEKEILHHNSSCYSLSKSKLAKDGYDSVFAKGGVDLRNNEFIVYDGIQCTIAYIIEIG
jgi:poly [ADP-ribose] polymerase